MTKDEEIAALKQEIARLNGLLEFIGSADSGGELHPVGPSDRIYAEDENTLIEVVGPWYFLDGKGSTFIEAIEDCMKKWQDD